MYINNIKLHGLFLCKNNNEFGKSTPKYNKKRL